MAPTSKKVEGVGAIQNEAFLKWKIWYGDGSFFTNLDGPPEKAPNRDIQIIVFYDEVVGRGILSGFDYYWYENEEWAGGDIFGLYDFLLRTGKVMFGRMMANTTKFHEIQRKARQDTNFPETVGRHRVTR